MYTSPNYAKGKKFKASAVDPGAILDLVQAEFRSVRQEPVLAEGELAVTEEGDWITVEQLIPLVRI